MDLRTSKELLPRYFQPCFTFGRASKLLAGASTFVHAEPKLFLFENLRGGKCRKWPDADPRHASHATRSI